MGRNLFSCRFFLNEQVKLPICAYFYIVFIDKKNVLGWGINCCSL